MKIALLHRHPSHKIKETNAAYPYLLEKGIDVLTLKDFDRLSHNKKYIQSLIWLFLAPYLVWGKNYDTIYCDDSFPFYPALVKMVSPNSKIIIRLGDFHLMYYTRGWVYKFLHYFERIGWDAADKILAISEAMKEYLLDEGYDSEVIPDPVEPANFLPDTNIKQSDNVVMFHGVVTKNKHLDYIIQAAQKLPEVYFWIVGDGPDIKRLKNIAGRNVVFSGWHNRDQIRSFLNYCTIGLALRSNNIGNEFVVTSPFLQYAAASKPCLVTRRRVFGDYPWQFSSVDEMVDKIKILLKSPKEGKKLREKVLKKHNARKVSEMIWSQL